MKRFLDLPIRQKMLSITLLICGAVLVVAIAALFVFQVLNFRSNFQRDASTLAAIVASHSGAAVAFKDDTAADEMVGSFRAKPTVLTASLHSTDGSSVAHFGKAEDAKALLLFPSPGENRFFDGYLLLTESVVVKNERVGTLYMRMDYQRTFRELLRFYGLVVLGITIVSIASAVFLSSRLGRTITGPVLQLSRTAKIVGEKKDYSVRASVSSRDEMGSLADSFNEMLSRIETQDAALSLSQQKMEALIHSIDGIVWERAADTFQFTFVSRQSEVILGYPPSAWLDEPMFWQDKLHSQDAAKAVQAAREMSVRGQSYTLEYRIMAADGRAVWIRESGTALVENGRPLAIRGIFQDITQAKLNAAELDKLNRQLMDTSRHAGMADVATGVLHNVGNVLNSVSVSATLVGERLRASNVGDLRRATTMMLEQNGRLAEFLTNDPKGKLIPEFLGSVAEALAEEQTELITEISSVGQHIEHIKEIVAMQQSYAKLSGVHETLPPADLVEDALSLNVAAFERHHIELVREFDKDLPNVCV
ncbi:MAG TPA: PAS domain-containing protein, partial [Candidatus Acidoferrum sp.]|nr:PAS domain-containing protein [Candidatus Acidoferrum sp.]